MNLESLKPTRRERVFDLVEAAGFDMSDWINSARNCPVKANPKYCYEWAFVEPQQRVLLNLWWDMFDELPDGSIAHRHNFRDDARANEGKPTWVMRATRLDNAVQTALDPGVELRVIINHGRKRNRGDPKAERSHVTARQLDPERWTVTSYDRATGTHVIRRGAHPVFVDQYSVQVGAGDARRVDRTGSAYARDRAVRDAALARAKGRCEHCGEAGFAMANGGIYLETHHVVPLCEGGADDMSNVAALCPNDHKKAHFGVERDRMRLLLLTQLAG